MRDDWKMAPSPRIPEPLLRGPFTPQTAAEYGVSERMLRGKSWRRLHPRVWVHRTHVMTHRDDVTAATLSMPARARLSHVSRIQMLGLDIGPHDPIHFTIAGDHHIATEGIFLHRTEVMPPCDDVGVSGAAAFLQFCASARLMDAIIAGDWLLAEGHMTAIEVRELAVRDDWRPGAWEALTAVSHLDARAWSPKESELRVVLKFAGLPAPEINVPVMHGNDQIAIVDLLLENWRLAIEYEGRQHALDTHQFQHDITRYARLREAGYEYVQVTQRMLRQPQTVALHIEQVLRRRGYEGPPPTFGHRWRSLFQSIQPRDARGAVRERRFNPLDTSLPHRPSG